MTILYMLVIAYALAIGETSAMEHFTTSLQDEYGRAIQGAMVSVKVAGSSTNATLYTDNGVTAKANPFITGIDGVVDFYASNGVYDIIYTKSGKVFNPDKTKRIALFDVSDGGGGAGGSATITSGTPLPSTCTTGTFFLETVDELLYICTSTNTYSPLSATAGGLDANFDTTNGNILTGSSEAKQLKLLDSGGTNGGTFYWHSSGRFIIRCIVANVEGNCDIGVPLNDGKTWSITNSTGTATYFQVSQATGKVSTATIDCRDSGVSCTVLNTKEFEFAGCQSGVAGLIWNTATTNAPTAACDPDSSNITGAYASFNDSTDQYIDANLRLPAGYVSGSLEFIWHWKAAATTGAAGWCTQIARVPQGSSSNPTLAAQGTGNCTSGTTNATTLLENRTTNFNPNCTSCTGGDELKIRFSRDANGSAVTDSLVGNGHVMKVIARWAEVQ